jgi:D-alanyl-lipoteichoic acid acyltransferase DltB (MBOAT superfamily)
MGLWHGAAWTFVWWGTAWGVLLYLNRLWRRPSRVLERKLPALEPAFAVFGTVLTYHLFVFSAILFMSPSMAYSATMVELLLSPGWLTPRAVQDFVTVGFYVAPLLLIQIAQWLFNDLEVVGRLPAVGRFTVYVTLLLLLVANGSAQLNEFFYFQF